MRAEEGIAAQIRKEARYQELLEQINSTKTWKARLLNIEIGARGLVGSSTFRVFRMLGLSTPQAKTLVKILSEVVVRCSYAIYLAHNSPVWPHNSDLVITNKSSTRTETHKTPNIVALRNQGIRFLFHFTDSANLDSIREFGLMSAATLHERSIEAKMNSDERSRRVDKDAGLQTFVRLSFSSSNPMMYVAKKEGRISDPVVLKIKLEAVSRPGVMFSDCDATRHDATIADQPDIVRFEIVKAKKVFDVPDTLQRFYQAEVLVPSPVPPHLIVFPKQNRKTRLKA